MVARRHGNLCANINYLRYIFIYLMDFFSQEFFGLMQMLLAEVLDVMHHGIDFLLIVFL